METEYPIFVPNLSISRPTTMSPSAYAAWNAVTIYPYWISFHPISV